MACVFVALILAVPAAEARGAEGLCELPVARRYPSLGRSIGITVDADWIAGNIDAIHESFGPGCQAFSECLSAWGNSVEFCRLRLTIALRAECEKTWDMSTDLRGWQQCRAVADIFSIGQRQIAQRAWPGLQQLAEREAAGNGVPSPVVMLDPPAPEPDAGVSLAVKAFHPETGAPMEGRVTVEGVLVGETFQEFDYTLRFVPVADELGRISLHMPVIVVHANPARGSNAPAYASVPALFSTPIPETTLSFDPPPERWTVGENVVRVAARDAKSGEALEGRILRPGGVLGDAHGPVTIVLRDDAGLCGDPLWFRPREANRPDTSLPVAPCR